MRRIVRSKEGRFIGFLIESPEEAPERDEDAKVIPFPEPYKDNEEVPPEPA